MPRWTDLRALPRRRSIAYPPPRRWRCEPLERRLLLATVSGEVFNDLNADGTRQAGEDGLGGVTVYWDKDWSGSLTAGDESKTTGAAGDVQFDVPWNDAPSADNCHVFGCVAKAGFRQTGPGGINPESGDQLSLPIVIWPPGVNDPVDSFLFGQARGIIRGTVFNDLDADGVWDGGEPPLPGSTVIDEASGKTAVSDAEGRYELNDLQLDSCHFIRTAPRAGWRQTHPEDRHYIYLSRTNPESSALLGQTDKARISGSVFNDANASGFREGELGLPGWTVFLDRDGNGLRDQEDDAATTDAVSNYVMNVAVTSGSCHALRVVEQAAWRTTTPVGGAHLLTVEPGSITTGKDFGETAHIDLDLDSDNNNGVGSPDRSDAEERVENHEPGKFIRVNDGTQSFTDFTPAVLELNPALIGSQTTVSFNYSDGGPGRLSGRRPRVVQPGWYLPAIGPELLRILARILRNDPCAHLPA